jgi:hypothetical protein
VNRREIIAHRGCSARYPDNSRPALKAALVEGADANDVSLGLLVEIKDPVAAHARRAVAGRCLMMSTPRREQRREFAFCMKSVK